MRQLLIAFSTVLVAAATVAAQRGLQSDPGADVAKGIPSPTGRESNGGVEFINPGTPVLSDAELNSQPVPRLPDGHIDLTGPWVGGGTIADIERDGGLKPGELPLLPWAKELRDKRNSKDDPYTACLPMAVLRTNPYPWKFVMGYTSKGLTHIYILHELMDDGTHRVVYMDGRNTLRRRFPPGSDTQSADGRATRSSSTRWGSTTSSGSIGMALRTPSSFTSSSVTRVRTMARSSTTSPSKIPVHSRVR